MFVLYVFTRFHICQLNVALCQRAFLGDCRRLSVTVRTLQAQMRTIFSMKLLPVKRIPFFFFRYSETSSGLLGESGFHHKGASYSLNERVFSVSDADR